MKGILILKKKSKFLYFYKLCDIQNETLKREKVFFNRLLSFTKSSHQVTKTWGHGLLPYIASQSNTIIKGLVPFCYFYLDI